MAGACVWLSVLMSGLLVVGAHPASSSSPPPHQTSQGENCQGDAVFSLMRTAGCSPACLASSFSLYSQIQEQNQFDTFAEEIRELLHELKPAAVRPCPGQIIEETDQWRWRPRNCQDLHDEGDSGHGVRQVYPFPRRPLDAADVYCDHTIDGGGWTVVLRRTNANTREDFYRTWAEYVQGFGTLTGEFWIGLELLHILTSSIRQELRVDLVDFTGEQRWAKYSDFKVGPTYDHYNLTINGYTGDAGDAMTYSNGAQFTTHDADHDTSSDNCAEKYRGAWWHKSCHHANPNGYQYEGDNSPAAKGIVWYQWKGWTYSLMNNTFLIRPVV